MSENPKRVAIKNPEIVAPVLVESGPAQGRNADTPCLKLECPCCGARGMAFQSFFFGAEESRADIRLVCRGGHSFVLRLDMEAEVELRCVVPWQRLDNPPPPVGPPNEVVGPIP